VGIETALLIAGLAIAGAGTGYQIKSGMDASAAQEKAQIQAKEAAVKQEQATTEATNRANQKKPDTLAILSAAQNAAKSGTGSTMLTGPRGLDASALSLGKTSLLGA
jgi:hypothetical protein